MILEEEEHKKEALTIQGDLKPLPRKPNSEEVLKLTTRNLILRVSAGALLDSIGP